MTLLESREEKEREIAEENRRLLGKLTARATTLMSKYDDVAEFTPFKEDYGTDAEWAVAKCKMMVVHSGEFTIALGVYRRPLSYTSVDYDFPEYRLQIVEGSPVGYTKYFVSKQKADTIDEMAVKLDRALRRIVKTYFS